MSELAGLDAVTEAVETGAGLPEVVRAAARALDASLAATDAAGGVLAIAARSPAEERSLLSQGEGVQSVPLRIADTVVGTLHIRMRAERSASAQGASPRSASAQSASPQVASARSASPQVASARSAPAQVASARGSSLVRLIVTMIASEVERVRAPERASESAAGDFLRALLNGELNEREQILGRAGDLSLDLSAGACLLIARARPQVPAEEGWRLRVRSVAERGARAVVNRVIAALSERDGMPAAEVVLLVPGGDEQVAVRAAEAVTRELQAALSGCTFALGRSRIASDPGELPRAVSEALLAANVADGEGREQALAFEDTGAYRLLLSTMSENPHELRRFYEETVEPLVAYDEQYETDLLQTLDAFLDADGNVAKSAQRLFTHRHTVYYRLDRIRELTGLDVSSSDGREKLSLGLKAMRVLGLSSATGPASEAGAGGGRVPRGSGGRVQRRPSGH